MKKKPYEANLELQFEERTWHGVGAKEAHLHTLKLLLFATLAPASPLLGTAVKSAWKKTSYTHAALSCISKLGAIFNEAYKSPLKQLASKCASAYSPAVKSCLHLGLDWQIILAPPALMWWQLCTNFHLASYPAASSWIFEFPDWDIHDDKLKGDNFDVKLIKVWVMFRSHSLDFSSGIKLRSSHRQNQSSKLLHKMKKNQQRR